MTSTDTCFHCALPNPKGCDLKVEIEGIARPVCCPGCKSVAELIRDSGMSNYYTMRDAPSPGVGRPPDDIAEWQIFNNNEMLQAFDKRRRYMVERLNAIEGFSCSMPKGAFYTFPTVAGVYGKKSGETVIQGSSDLATVLLEKARVAVVAGSAFGSDDNIRLSYAISLENIEKGLDRIEAFVKTLT